MDGWLYKSCHKTRVVLVKAPPFGENHKKMAKNKELITGKNLVILSEI
jgi:hypothetical protein